MKGLLGKLRRLSGVGEAELVPQARLSGPMPWVIAIMLAMTVIAAAAGLGLRNMARSAALELEGGMTVQIVEARADGTYLVKTDNTIEIEGKDKPALVARWLSLFATRDPGAPAKA